MSRDLLLRRRLPPTGFKPAIQFINRVANRSATEIEKGWGLSIKPALRQRALAQSDVIRGLWGSQHSPSISHCSTIRCAGISQPIRRNMKAYGEELAGLISTRSACFQSRDFARFALQRRLAIETSTRLAFPIAFANALLDCVGHLHSFGRHFCSSHTKRVKGDCLSLLLLLPASLRTPWGKALSSAISVSRRIHSAHPSPSLKDGRAPRSPSSPRVDGGGSSSLRAIMQADWNDVRTPVSVWKRPTYELPALSLNRGSWKCFMTRYLAKVRASDEPPVDIACCKSIAALL